MTPILYLSHCGSSIGGGERQLYLLVTALDKIRYHPLVVCPDDGPFADQLRHAGIATTILPLPAWRKARSFGFRSAAAHQLIQLAKQHSIGLIHTSDSWFNPYALKVSSALEVPSVSHVRTPIRPDQVRKYRFKEISSIITISERFNPPLLEAGVPSERLTFIHDAVDLDRFNVESVTANVLRREFGAADALLIGLVGRIEPFKKQVEFLKAAEILLKSRQDVRFFLIGGVQSDSYFQQVKRLIGDKGLEAYVLHTGARDDMPEVLADLDILVTLSGGSIVFEAMACRLPVIFVENAPPYDLSREMAKAEKTGFLVQHEDSETLVEAMMRLIDNSAFRKRMGQAGRRWAEQKFSHHQMTRRTEAIYDQLLAEQLN